MSLSSTRGIVRVARNPSCDLQAAMVAERVKEKEFYESVAGTPYPGEYGERPSARRRGTKFEENLHANDAAQLRKVLGPAFDVDPEAMTVRNFADEIPGPPDTMRALRLSRTRKVFADLAAGRPVPDILIQPQLELTVGPAPTHFEYVSPDFLVLDRKAGMYRPGEEKSFITREGAADNADKDLVRRQAAVQILALRQEAARRGTEDRVADFAVFVFATPFGLAPAKPVREPLPQELHEAQRALEVVRRVRNELAARRGTDTIALVNLVDELDFNFKEACFSHCILATVCEKRHDGQVRQLGDNAASVFGDELPLDRIVALIDGDAPRDDVERDLAPRLADAASIVAAAESARQPARQTA